MKLVIVHTLSIVTLRGECVSIWDIFSEIVMITLSSLTACLKSVITTTVEK